ncbi:MAG TPA: branched-chain amino acid ABC transporter permease [Burkholderiales bacterium]|nr:branched-chain amino acid ABC transporter permease [Burkholderiales bacterium]
MDKKTAALYAALFALGLAAPFAVYPVFLMKCLCFALFACAFNLLLGFAGLLSFGHCMFLGSAGYAAGYLLKAKGVPTEVAMLAGVGVSTAIGCVVGALAIRRQGIYFAMITLALSQMIYFFCVQAPFTGAEDGLQGIPRGTLLGIVNLDGEPLVMYYFVYAVFVFAFCLIYRIVHSPYGQVLKAIRENEPRALSLGYDVDRYKLMAFVLSGALAGLAGVMKMLVFKFETLNDVHWSMSGEVVLMTLIGGVGTLLGPVVGAFTVVTLQNQLAELEGWVTVIQGAIFVVCVLAFRRGVVGEVDHWLKKPR